MIKNHIYTRALGAFEPSSTGNFLDVLPMVNSSIHYLKAGHEWHLYHNSQVCEDGLARSLRSLKAIYQVFTECLDMDACSIHVIKTDKQGNLFNLYPWMSFIDTHGRALLDQFLQLHEMMRLYLHPGNLQDYKSLADFMDNIMIQICEIMPSH